MDSYFSSLAKLIRNLFLGFVGVVTLISAVAALCVCVAIAAL